MKIASDTSWLTDIRRYFGIPRYSLPEPMMVK